METVPKDFTYVEICIDEDIIYEASHLSGGFSLSTNDCRASDRDKITNISGNTTIKDNGNADINDKYMLCEDTGEFTSHNQDTVRADMNSTVVYEKDNHEFDSVMAVQEQNEFNADFLTGSKLGFLSNGELSDYLQEDLPNCTDNAYQIDKGLITDEGLTNNTCLGDKNEPKLLTSIDKAYLTDNRQKSSDCNEGTHLSDKELTTDRERIPTNATDNTSLNATSLSDEDLIINKDFITDENYSEIARSLLNDIIDYIIKKDISDKTEICNICERMFDSSDKLERHLKFHKKGRKVLYCHVCGKDFDQKSHLEYHTMVFHTSVKPYTCEICGKTFTHKSSLNMHIKSHTSQPNVPCEICGKKFWTKHILNTHRKKRHMGKPFVCNICGSSFSQKKSLVRHVNQHPPHICEICGKKFDNYKSLRLHFPSHKPSCPEHVFGDDANTFLCKVCKRTFRRRQDLTFHSQAHAPRVHKCQVCGAGYVRYSFLKKHMIAHSNRPYKCKLCGKCFHYEWSLENHQKYHTGFKRLGCHICGRRYYFKHRLAIHLKHHKNVITENAVPSNDFEFTQQTSSTLQCGRKKTDEASGIGSTAPSNGGVMLGNCISVGQKGNSQTSTFTIGEAEEFNLGSVKFTGHKIIFSPEVNSLSLPSEQTQAIAILDAKSILTFAMHNFSKKSNEPVKVPKMTNIMTIREGESYPYKIRTIGDEHS
uniref:zinc finger protein 675-like n=1 Tax=Styela clava TaxID=7725 RepID=UPI00193A00CE|nr:zinc finger protein 675-like [Styela clava]